MVPYAYNLGLKPSYNELVHNVIHRKCGRGQVKSDLRLKHSPVSRNWKWLNSKRTRMGMGG